MVDFVFEITSPIFIFLFDFLRIKFLKVSNFIAKDNSLQNRRTHGMRNVVTLEHFTVNKQRGKKGSV